jgi:hypothetical protein
MHTEYARLIHIPCLGHKHSVNREHELLHRYIFQVFDHHDVLCNSALDYFKSVRVVAENIKLTHFSELRFHSLSCLHDVLVQSRVARLIHHGIILSSPHKQILGIHFSKVQDGVNRNLDCETHNRSFFFFSVKLKVGLLNSLIASHVSGAQFSQLCR